MWGFSFSLVGTFSASGASVGVLGGLAPIWALVRNIFAPTLFVYR